MSQLSTGNGKTKTAAQSADGIDYVDPVRVVAERWRWSYDSIMREVARGNLKLTVLGPRRKGIRRSEQRRTVETQVQVGISAELERILQEHDGQSRSIPAQGNGALLLAETIPSSSNEP